MARSVVGLRAFIEDMAGGYKSILPTDIINLSPPEHEVQVQLVSGDNTITVPALALGCVIVFHVDSTVTKTLKGTGADDGIAINRNNWMVLTFQNASGTFVITASADDETGAEVPLYTRIIFF